MSDAVRSQGRDASLHDRLARAEHREPLVADDGKSGNPVERVVIDGERYVLKTMAPAQDWLMRVTGDRVFWPERVWRAGVLDLVPPVIDHAMVAMAVEGDGPGARLLILMRDVGASLVPEGDEPVPIEMHHGFLDHMAAFHAAGWGWHDDIGLQTVTQRLGMFAPATIAPELAVAPAAIPVPIRVADEGWRRLPDVAPTMAAAVLPLHDDPAPLVHALAATPSVFLHGDWKMGNLGRHEDGRTVLLDWAYLGAGPPCWDLAWYLALNRARLPESKDAAIARYRAALDAAGVATEPWFDHQLALTLLGMMVVVGWEKAVGDRDELAWWVAAVERAAPELS